ncbi:hypothetical protein [Phreatobacter sp.]|uniref:hypothetical protein n=1 Tax=Phreatobacter sp. TaxID=1966341 RepID=UPI003F717FAE
MRVRQLLVTLSVLTVALPATAQHLPKAQELPGARCTATRGLVCEKGECQPRTEPLDIAITIGSREVRLCMRRGTQDICANLDALDIVTYPAAGAASARLVYRDGAQLLGNSTYMIDISPTAGVVVTALRGGSVVITTGTCTPPG